MIGFLRRALEFALEQPDSVCQDHMAHLYGEYRGVMVDLVPVEDATGRIVKWVPDQELTAAIDRRLDGVPFAPAQQAPAAAPGTQASPGLPGLKLP